MRLILFTSVVLLLSASANLNSGTRTVGAHRSSLGRLQSPRPSSTAGASTGESVPGASFTAGATTYTEQRGYDLVGNVAFEVDGNGHRTQKDYDFANRLVKVTDPVGRVEERAYDPNGNLVSTVRRGSATGPAQLTRTSTGYDALNRSLGWDEQGVGLDGASFHYTTAAAYDDAQHRVLARDARGFVTTTALGDLDRPYQMVVDNDVSLLPR